MRQYRVLSPTRDSFRWHRYQSAKAELFARAAGHLFRIGQALSQLNAADRRVVVHFQLALSLNPPLASVSNSVPRPIVCRRVSGNGDAPNSIPCVIVRPFQGECVRLWFSSRTPSHGKSARSRKYPNCTRSRVALPSRCPDRDFVLASDPVNVRPVF